MATAILDALKGTFGDAVIDTTDQFGDQVALVKREALVDVMRFLRDDPAMAMNLPSFCTCVDYLGMEELTPSVVSPMGVPAVHKQADATGPRFDMVYQLRSLGHGHTVRIKVPLTEDDLVVPTLSGLWPAFNWLEREVYDMYGVSFEGHPDLRRIYMYEEFVGHPLRKDYPKERRQPLVRREWSDE